MRDLARIAILFVLAVLAGVLITPLMSIVFLIAARIGFAVWHDARQAYLEEVALAREKPKRKHILTADGERLEITVAEDNDEQQLFSAQD
jgi:hypothetical protein